MMGKTYTAANGQVVTDEMIDAWCESYERGEFPDGEHTVGGIVHCLLYTSPSPRD